MNDAFTAKNRPLDRAIAWLARKKADYRLEEEPATNDFLLYVPGAKRPQRYGADGNPKQDKPG